MNALCTVVATIVAVAVVFRLIWWAYGRSHQLASQRQGSTASPPELSQTGPGTVDNSGAPGGVDSQGQKK